MKKIIILLVLILTINTGFANEINEYILELATEINVGNGEGEIGWNEELAQLWGISKLSFIITDSKLVYVCDSFNSRLNVYDNNFNFKKSISVKYGIAGAKRLYIDDKENIVSLSSPSGLVKVNKTGELVFQIKYRDLPGKMKAKKEFFIFDEDVLYFDKNENLIIINGEGESKKEPDFQIALGKYNKKSLDSKNELLLTMEEGSEEKIKEFVKSKKLLEIDGVLYTGHFEKLKEYNEKINELKKTRIINNNSTILNKIYDNALYLIDYDNDGNSYWKGEAKKQNEITGHNILIVLVCSKQGEIVDCFYNSLDKSSIAVAPNGDVYFRESVPTDGKFHFYKITRRW